MTSVTHDAEFDDRPGVVLLRNSTGSQVDNPRSLKAEQIARALLEERGIRVGAVLDEQGTSGADLRKRPIAAKLIDEVEAGQWAAVSMIEVSRASRDPDGVDQRIFKRACKRGGALLLTPTKAFDFRNDSDDLQFEVEAVFSAQEWKKLRKRSFEGNTERARIIPVFFGFPPFGYRPTTAEYTIRGTTRTVRVFEKHPEHAQLMEAIRAALDAEDGLQAVAWRLNKEGWLQPNGSRWYWSQIEKVLTTPLYAGEYRYGRLREKSSADLWRSIAPIPDRHVPELAWYDIESMNRWRLKFAPKKGKVRVRPQGWARPLLGVLICKYCGAPMMSQGGRGYGCSQRSNSVCRGQNLSGDQAERPVRDLLVTILPDLAELTRRVQASLQGQEAPDLAAELRQVMRQITVRQEMEVSWRLNDQQPTQEFLVRNKELHAERADLERRLQDAEGAELERRRLLRAASQFTDADAFLALYDHMSAGEKRVALGQLLKWVTVDTNGGRGNRAKSWVSGYEVTFPKSDSESALWMSWLTRFHAA